MKTIPAGVLMHNQAIVAVMLAGMPTMAARAEAPMCDAFITRLRDAGRALTFPLPAVKIERNPYINDYDAYWISYDYAGDVEWEGSLSCNEGRVVDYEISFDDYDLRRAASPFSLKNLRAWHMVSAAVYAFTGWPARQAVNAARDVLAKQSLTLTSPVAEVPLSDDATISVGYATVIINTSLSVPPPQPSR
jgi:hypothetical protein